MKPLTGEFCAAAFNPQAAAPPAEEDSDGQEGNRDEWDDAEPTGATPSPAWALSQEEMEYLNEVGIELTGEYARNLERLMEVLHSLRFVLNRSAKPAHYARGALLTTAIGKIQSFLWDRCTQGAFANGDFSLRDLYEKFYRKLVLRDRTLPRPWVFTTNYDLFNETAMDRLGIPYANGFSGVIERRFNPATFRYALAEQLDVWSRKWSAVDAFVYLCKLHGSISWTEDDHSLSRSARSGPRREVPK
jgi:SIR2-like domain